jgi:hypothetical protein
MTHNRDENETQTKKNTHRTLKGCYWLTNYETLINYYKTCIRPIIEYAHIPFESVNKYTLNQIQITENKILRTCLNSQLKDSTIKIHEKAKVQLITACLNRLISNYYNKIINYKTNTLTLADIELQKNQNQSYDEPPKRRKRKPVLKIFYA